ncbi:MAG: DEAD/DEAH box helicase [Muribaculaceae bacterium]|nr:DEAD/DEAH box helicase [Muribaculaceae bacterium]
MTDQEILRNIADRMSITTLMPLQEAMLVTPEPRILLVSPTGTGKTLAFTIRLLRALRPPCGKLQAIILAPSRELALQISSVIRPLAVGYKTVPLYGGHPMQEEIKTIAGSVPDIIVATPGRLLDHINRATIDVSTATNLILDEYDKSLELGFYDEMRRITRRLPAIRLLILTSATLLPQLPDFIDTTGLVTLDYRPATESPRTRTQIVDVPSPSRDKIETLVALLNTLYNTDPHGKTIVFSNHRESAERIHQHLLKAGFPAGIYHGGLDQQQRELAVDLLDNGTTPILSATDLASRGLDLTDITNVIHYHLPPSPEAWTHRNGRTARMGAAGTVYVITGEADNIPDFVRTDRSYVPDLTLQHHTPTAPAIATLYINAGKKEKISRGDVAGYLMQRGGLSREEVGKIVVKDHASIVAVPADKAREVIKSLEPYRLKNTRVRVTRLKM